MRSGSLRHRVKIQSKTATTDAYGGMVETWADVCTVSASIEPLSGRELITAQSVKSETTGKIRIRYRAGITPAMRVTFNGKIFNIQTVINFEERNRELILMVSEGINEG